MSNDCKDFSGFNINSELNVLDWDLLESYRQNFKNFRETIIEKSLLPYMFVEVYPKPTRDQAILYANSMLTNGWIIGEEYISPIKPPLKWSLKLRSFEVKLHCWQPIQRLLIAYDLDKSWDYFQAALDMAEDWITTCPVQLTSTSLADASARVGNDYEKGSWWYDMAIAQRLNQLTYIVDICCRNPEISNERIFLMMDQILLHHVILTFDSLYKRHTNHGFFQALHHYAAIKRLPEFDYDEYFLKIARRRFKEMIEQQYTSEMVHREHSPWYHYMITVALVNAYRSGLLDDEESSKLRQAEMNLGWMTRPSGNVVLLGDSESRNLFSQTEVEFFSEPSLVEMLSGGEQITGVKEFSEAGYAFARLYAPNANKSNPQEASYLAQIAAFHSRVHKHADHLSFVWFDKERDILIDPGRYGYVGRTEKGSDLFNEGFWYSDPKRVYCESTRAHNTIEIDGKNFPRKVKPFGSALSYAGEVSGRAETYSKVIHFQFIRHHRHLIMSPGKFLLVLDWLKDYAELEHEYRQYFHFASEWDIHEQNGQIIGYHPGTEEKTPVNLRVASLIPEVSLGNVIRGQEKPELLGWLSDKAYSLIPTSCFHVYKKSSEPTSFATLFVFGKNLEINWKKTRFNRSLSAGRVAWSDDQGEQELTIKKPS